MARVSHGGDVIDKGCCQARGDPNAAPASEGWALHSGEAIAHVQKRAAAKSVGVGVERRHFVLLQEGGEVGVRHSVAA